MARFRRVQNRQTPPTLTEAQAKAELRAPSGRDRRARQALLPAGPAERHRRRIRRAARPQRRDRDALPRSGARRIRRRCRVGAAPTGKFKKVRHAVPMLSLDNAFADEDVVDFVARIRRFLKLATTRKSPSAPSRRSMACRCRCATRTANSSPPPPAATAARARTSPPISSTLKEVPQHLKGRHVPKICEVRGEVYMTKPDFLKLNERQKAAGEHDLRQSAQFRRRLAAPEGSGRHRLAPARLLRLRLGRDERDAGRHANPA